MQVTQKTSRRVIEGEILLEVRYGIRVESDQAQKIPEENKRHYIATFQVGSKGPRDPRIDLIWKREGGMRLVKSTVAKGG